jgi:hypothetical protein
VVNRVPRLLSLTLLPAALAPLLAACDSTAAQPAPATTKAAAAPAPPCAKLPDPVLPQSAGALTEQQNAVYCLPRGQRVDVFLTAVKGSRWQPVKASGDGVLTPTNTDVMTAPIGVTPAMFVGTTDGTSVLTSSTPSGGSWKVTVVVEG